MDKYAIIVAGGKGLRMGGDLPKQFIPVGGIPILMRTLKAFHKADQDTHLILVLPVDQQEYWIQLCEDYHFDIPHKIVNGGETRFHSVSHGLEAIPENVEGVVAVHDGVRPFVSSEVIQQCFQTAWERGSAVPVVPVVETVRQLLPEGDSLTVDRNAYRLVQTPQTFPISVLKEAYRQPYTPFFTDDASVVEECGANIVLVDGNRENIKITTPSDLAYAEFLTHAD